MSKEFIPNFVEVVQAELKNCTFINDKGKKELNGERFGQFLNDFFGEGVSPTVNTKQSIVGYMDNKLIEIPHFVYTSQDNDNSVFDTLDEKELLQLAHIVRKLYDNDIKLKIDYRVFK